MNSTESFAATFASLAQMRVAIDAMVHALIIAVISVAAVPQGCSITFQKALLEGSIALFAGAFVMLIIACHSEIAAGFKFIRQFMRRLGEYQPKAKSKDT
jgi:hypothetical protein